MQQLQHSNLTQYGRCSWHDASHLVWEQAHAQALPRPTIDKQSAGVGDKHCHRSTACCVQLRCQHRYT